ncbi:MAG: diacylglycerol/lipid kinase family protein [Carbonactinosporaceae bacterium]
MFPELAVALAAVIVLTAVGCALVRHTRQPSRRERGRGRGPAGRRAAIVLNPTKVADVAAYRARIAAEIAALGWKPPLWYETTEDESGRQLAEEAVRRGADVVYACGGDGTVMACVAALAGTGVPLAVLPTGTGNLLARNLALPADPRHAVRVGVTGVDRRIDVGRVREPSGDLRFAVMAGIGFDAAMVADTVEPLKRRLGWTAYAVAGLRHLSDRRMQVCIRLDDEPPIKLRARAVIVGNVGRLRAGLQLIPDARPDDGLLDVVVLAPRGLPDWVRVGVRVLARRHGGDSRIAHFQARQVSIVADREEPRQLDGELIDRGTTLDITTEPGALLVRVP